MKPVGFGDPQLNTSQPESAHKSVIRKSAESTLPADHLLPFHQPDAPETRGVERYKRVLEGIVDHQALQTNPGSKALFTSEDIGHCEYAGDPFLDGHGNVFFEKVSSNLTKNDYTRELWIVPKGSMNPKPKKIAIDQSGQPFSGRACLSSDGKHLAFLRKGPHNEGYHICHAGLDLDAFSIKDERQSTNYAAVSDLAWSPKNESLLFSAKDKNNQEKHIFTLNKNGVTQQVTRDDMALRDISHPIWHPDGKSIAFIAQNLTQQQLEQPKKSYIHDIFLAKADGSQIPQRQTQSIGEISEIAFSPNGQRIAFIGHDKATESTSKMVDGPNPWRIGQQLFCLELRATPAENIIVPLSSKLDRAAGNYIIPNGGESPFTEPQRPAWSEDGKNIFALISDQGECGVQEFDATGSAKPRKITPEGRTVSSFGVKDNRCVYVFSNSTTLNGFHEVSTSPTPAYNGEGKKLAELNEWLQERVVQQQHALKNSPVNTHIFITEPSKSTTSGAVPLVAIPHGGPHLADGETFSTLVQTLASKGYRVMSANIPGSQSYGKENSEATNGAWGKKDLDAWVSALEFVRQEYKLGEVTISPHVPEDHTTTVHPKEYIELYNKLQELHLNKAPAAELSFDSDTQSFTFDPHSLKLPEAMENTAKHLLTKTAFFGPSYGAFLTGKLLEMKDLMETINLAGAAFDRGVFNPYALSKTSGAKFLGNYSVGHGEFMLQQASGPGAMDCLQELA